MITTIEENKIKTQRDVSSPLPSVGSMVEGKVVARDRSSLFVDLGIGGTGIIYGKEFYLAKDTIKNLKIGDTVQAKVIELENEDGYRELSLKDASKEISWQKIRELKDKEELIKVTIKGVNKGGLLTTLNNMPAFLPVSHLSPQNYPRVSNANKQEILRELQKFIGKELEVKILDVAPKDNKLILSEKAKAEQEIKEILQNYKKGDIVEGKITGIADFGAFIKFPLLEETTRKDAGTDPSASLGTGAEQHGNEEENKTASSQQSEARSQIEGLIHISEMDWQLVGNPSEVVKVGDIVKAEIINIEGSQVFLSLKNLTPNPWQEIEKQYKKGDKIKGKVVSLHPFGAFVQVTPKIRGLCHISEFSNKDGSASGGESEQIPTAKPSRIRDDEVIGKIKEGLLVGKEYEFEITTLEPKEYRLGLKLTLNP